MAYIFTYSNLTSLLQVYLERTDSTLVDQIPVFILLAQVRISREVKQLGTREVVNATFSGNTAVIQKPNDWRETITINYGTGTSSNTRTTLLPRGYEYCRSFWPDPTQASSQVKYYSDYNYNYWLVAPTPDSSYPFEVMYYSTLKPIDDTTQTNWLTQYAPDLLLYACLLETAPFLKDDERIPVWQQMYDRALASLNGEAKERIEDGASSREGDK
jgi:hypothetical protein